MTTYSYRCFRSWSLNSINDGSFYRQWLFLSEPSGKENDHNAVLKSFFSLIIKSSIFIILGCMYSLSFNTLLVPVKPVSVLHPMARRWFLFPALPQSYVVPQTLHVTSRFHIITAYDSKSCDNYTYIDIFLKIKYVVHVIDMASDKK